MIVSWSRRAFPAARSERLKSAVAFRAHAEPEVILITPGQQAVVIQAGVGAEFEHAAVARRGGNSGEKREPLVLLFLLASLAPEHLVGADPPAGEAVSPAGERSRVDEPALPPGELLEVEIQVELDEAIVFRPPPDAPRRRRRATPACSECRRSPCDRRSPSARRPSRRARLRVRAAPSCVILGESRENGNRQRDDQAEQGSKTHSPDESNPRVTRHENRLLRSHPARTCLETLTTEFDFGRNLANTTRCALPQKGLLFPDIALLALCHRARGTGAWWRSEWSCAPRGGWRRG